MKTTRETGTRDTYDNERAPSPADRVHDKRCNGRQPHSTATATAGESRASRARCDYLFGTFLNHISIRLIKIKIMLYMYAIHVRFSVTELNISVSWLEQNFTFRAEGRFGWFGDFYDGGCVPGAGPGTDYRNSAPILTDQNSFIKKLLIVNFVPRTTCGKNPPQHNASVG